MGVSGRHTVDLSKIRSGSSARAGAVAPAISVAASKTIPNCMVPVRHIIEPFPPKLGRNDVVCLSPLREGGYHVCQSTRPRPDSYAPVTAFP
ncbi:hypothetical protein GCM10007884_40700 [Methylobacterium brachythecii]|uniref:Uncharacterized protein n=1 Tax=Methylobacterium brachythecii TaxID=1176177 RepID=A0ABQ6D6V6_9HYPH|nr:hypothetical protein GCM10007884_40700 [Methylobacterium brachythecii]